MSARADRELHYTLYSCGCAVGVCRHEGLLLEAAYCEEGAGIGRRAEGYGKRLAEMAEAGKTRAVRRRKRALYLLMVRAVGRLESHRHRAGVVEGPLALRAGALPPPGNYVEDGREVEETA